MHEAPIAQAILDAALAAIPTPGAKITLLTIKNGPFSGADPDCLSFYFAELSKNTPAAGAELEFINAPATMTCDACGNTDVCETAASIQFTCQKCGHPATLQGGNDLYLDSIEVVTDDDP